MYFEKLESKSMCALFKLFYEVHQNMNIPRLYCLLNNCAKESVYNTFKIVFYIRSHVHGFGYRYLGRKAFVWLFINFPDEFLQACIHIPKYGRWDDILYLFPGVLNLDTVEFVQKNFLSPSIVTEKQLQNLHEKQCEFPKLFARQLGADRLIYESQGANEGRNMRTEYDIGICAKWAPSEGGFFDRKYSVVSTLCTAMGISHREYRVNYLSKLRNTVQRTICENKWDKVDYDTVPRLARTRLANAFFKHDPERYLEWIRLQCEKNTIASVSIQGSYTLPYFANIHPSHSSTIVVLDTSPGMLCKNKNALAIALAISRVSLPPYKGCVIGFSRKPVVINLEGDIVSEIASSNFTWDNRVDLNAVFELVRGGKNEDNVERRILVITDTKPDCALISPLPSSPCLPSLPVVFWNIKRNFKPVHTLPENSFEYISGYSSRIASYILRDGCMSQTSIMKKALENITINITC